MVKQIDSELKVIFQQVFPGVPVSKWDRKTLLLGALPEFDSMSIVTLLTLIEEQMGICIDDSELNANIFESYGSVLDWLNQQ